LDNAAKVHDFEQQSAQKIAEIQEKRADDIRNSFAEGVISLQGGGKSFRGFVLGQAQSLEKTVLSNLAGVVAPSLTGFPITKDSGSLLGKLAKNTIFGADQAQQPLAGAANILNNAGTVLSKFANESSVRLDSAAAHLESAAVALASSTINFNTGTGIAGTDVYGNPIPDPNLATGLSRFGSDTSGLTGTGGIIGQLSPLARAIGSIPGLPGGTAAGGILGTVTALQRAFSGDSGAPSITSARNSTILGSLRLPFRVEPSRAVP
jgi:hypothetical protein